jgi:tRNA1(Val) A37 N6-methylase TrmN6
MPAHRGQGSEDVARYATLLLKQPWDGHRVGHDALLLAAACPAHPGEHAVEFGAGIGAAGLVLAQRVKKLAVTLIDIDPELVRLAAENAGRNRLEKRVHALILDVGAPARAFAAAGLLPDSVMRVLMNPPFHDAGRHRLSPDPKRRLAHAASPETLPLWIKSAARLLRPSGTLTLIWRADGLADVLQALAPAFGAITVLPVHPKPATPAIRVLVRATKASRAPLTLLRGIALTGGSATPALADVMRGTGTLPLAEI